MSAPQGIGPGGALRGMAAVLHALVQGWRRPNVLSVIVGLGFIGGIGGATTVAIGSGNFVQIMTWVLGLLGLAGVWFLLVYGVLSQNSPHAARLVPGHLQRLRWTLMLGWLVVISAAAALHAWSGKVPFEARLGWTALALAALGLSLRWPMLWLSFWAVPSLGAAPLTALMTAVGGLPGPGGPTAVAVAMLLGLGWVQVRCLLGTGNAAHLRRHGRARAWTRMAARGGGVPAEAGAFMHRLAHAVSLPYRSALRRLSVPASTSPPWPRLMLAFGPQADWRTHLMWAALVCAGLVALMLVLRAQGRLPEDDWPFATLFGPLIGLMSLSINPVTTVLMGAARTAREQALLALLPGVPRGPALNRGLAGRWLGRFLLSWALGSAACLAFVSWASPGWRPDCTVALFGLLPMAVAMMPSLPHLSTRPGPRQFLVGALFIAGPLLSVTLSRWVGLPPPAVVALMAAGTALGVAWRWQALARGPSAFPAGRLA